MPAPATIDIRYADPTTLASLAAAAGKAGFNMDRFQMARQDWQDRAQMDNQFLMNDANRRSAESSAANALAFRYADMNRSSADSDRAFGLQQAIAADKSSRGWGNMGTREDIAAQNRAAQEQQLQETLAARRNGSARSGKPTQDMTLVPESGDTNVPYESTSSITPSGANGPPEPGRSVERYRGRTLEYGDAGSRDAARQAADSAATSQPQMVPRYVRSQLDAIEASGLPEDKKNLYRIAARDGTLKMDQLLDDMRGSTPHVSTARDLATKQAEKMNFDLNQIDNILNSRDLPDEVKADYARKKMGINPMFDDTPDAEILQKLQNYRQIIHTNIGAATKPVMNSGGRTPTGGNPVSINTQQDFNALPPGSWYTDAQTGHVGRKP